MENQNEGNTCEKSPQPHLYFDKGGKPLFGTSKPSAFAYAHPWPPTATNLSKKQVLRPQDDEQEPLPLRRSSSVDGGELFKFMPKSSSDIELALYWDRAPYWNFNLPKTMTCPVHGQVNTLHPNGSKLPSRPSTSISSQQEQNKNHESGHKPHMKKPQFMGPGIDSDFPHDTSKIKNHHRRSVSASFSEAKSKSSSGSSVFERERNREKNMASEHFMVREKPDEKLCNASDSNNSFLGKEMENHVGNQFGEETATKPPPEKSNQFAREYNFGEETKDYPEIEQKESHRSSNENSMVAHLGEKDEHDDKTGFVPRDSPSILKCSSMTQPPMLVRSISSMSNKSVKMADESFDKPFSQTPSHLCPLHGSYWRGVQRRNTPRFRTTVLKKDTEVQADLQITNCCNTRKRNPPSEFLRKTVGNMYSQRNLNNSSRGVKKDEGLSEYTENYKDPIIVAESKKRNRSTATCAISNRTFHTHNHVM